MNRVAKTTATSLIYGALALSTVLFMTCANVDRTDPNALTNVAWAASAGNNSSNNNSSSSNGSSGSLSNSTSSNSVSSISISSNSTTSSTITSSTISSVGISSSAITSSSKASSSSKALSSSLAASSSAALFENQNHSYGSVVMADNTYKTITISGQTWFAENLNEGVYKVASANGQYQRNSTTIIDSFAAQKYCYVDSVAYCGKGSSQHNYGGLYKWAYAMGLPDSCNYYTCSVSANQRGICPRNYHVATRQDFLTLQTNVRVNFASNNILDVSNFLKTYSNSDAAWDNTSRNFGDSLGFNALPTGLYYCSDPLVPNCFYENKAYAYFWTATQTGADSTRATQVNFGATTMGGSTVSDMNFDETAVKQMALPVRCVAN